MKAIDYLRKIESMEARINTRLEELESLKALATKTSSVMGGERVQSSGSQQKMADCINKIIDMYGLRKPQRSHRLTLKSLMTDCVENFLKDNFIKSE